MLNMDLSVQVKFVPSSGFWEYFCSHNNPEGFLLMIYSVPRDI